MKRLQSLQNPKPPEPKQPILLCCHTGGLHCRTSFSFEDWHHCSSADKESACNAGDLGSIPGLGRSPGGGNGNPLQYSCLENPMNREEPGRLQSVGVQELDTTERLSTHTSLILFTLIFIECQLCYRHTFRQQDNQ